MEGAAAPEHQTGLLDVDSDSLVLCASKLNVKDLANMAVACRRLRQIAYADPVWDIQCRLRWPPKETAAGMVQFRGGREEFLSRHVASQQLRFSDPVTWSFLISQLMVRQLLLDDDTVLAAQGSNVMRAKMGEQLEITLLRDHNARINCMRLFSENVPSFRGATSKLLVTCSADHTIRLWVNDRVVRSFRGHTGAVTVIADKLLGQGILASGGMDCMVRLWTTFGSHRKRTPLLATLHGHETYVKELLVAGHNPSILISGSKDSKLRVWDANTGDCVGTARGPPPLATLKSADCMCYVSGGSNVTAIDLRTLKTIGNVASHPGGILTTALSPSGWSLCTGGTDKTARLWDIRYYSDSKPAVAVLGKHDGPVRCLHFDDYKIITASLEDTVVRVWDAKDGTLLSSLDHEMGVSAIASQGHKLAVATYSDVDPGIVTFRDYSNCAEPLEQGVKAGSSKFWDI